MGKAAKRGLWLSGTLILGFAIFGLTTFLLRDKIGKNPRQIPKAGAADLRLLEDRGRWAEAAPEQQDQVVAAVADSLGTSFRWLVTERESCGGNANRIARFLHIKSGLEMSLIPGGAFAFGTADPDGEWNFCRGLDPSWERIWLQRETPRRRVSVAPMLVARREVDESAWEAVGEGRPGTLLPKVGIAWGEAAGWLDIAGGGLSLPSEAEWEYAARAGSRSRFFWGQELDDSYAWFRDNSGGRRRAVDDHADARNAFGLADTAGNVWEWCAEAWTEDHSKPRTGQKALGYVVKGGGCANGAASLRSASRTWRASGSRNIDVGFRAIRRLDKLFEAAESKAVPRKRILSDRLLWNRAGAKAQDAAIVDVGLRLGSAFEFVETEIYHCGAFSQRIASFRHIKSGAVLNLIPGGIFRMGSDDGFSVEKPTHEVRISRAFLMGRAELTAAEFAAIKGEKTGSDRPLASLSWDEARSVLTAAGDGLRLPSEAEWEYACRAGSETRYFWGKDFKAAYCVSGTSGTRTVVKGSEVFNGFGLVDMLGNLSEWCEDDWIDHYREGPTDALPRQTKRGLARVCRGGGWRYGERSCRSASRLGFAPDRRDAGVGVRLCRSVDGL